MKAFMFQNVNTQFNNIMLNGQFIKRVINYRT